MKDKMKELSAEALSLTEAISVIQEQLQEDEMLLLKVCIIQNAVHHCSQKHHTLTLIFMFSRISKTLRTGRSVHLCILTLLLL